jgi:hypothetical protein
MTRSLNPGGSMRLGSVDGNAGVAGREVESAMNESVGTMTGRAQATELVRDKGSLESIIADHRSPR